MADKASKTDEPETDEHGLVIQKYISTVLLIVPQSGYSEETLRYARSSLYNVHVGTWSVSTESSEMILGRLQDEFLVDGALEDVNIDDYSGVLLVSGDGCEALASDERVLKLVRAASERNLMLGAWGNSVLILAKAGVLKGQKVTGDPSLEAEIRSAGGKYLQRELVTSGKMVTARDDAVGLRFGKALVQVVGID